MISCRGKTETAGRYGKDALHSSLDVRSTEAKMHHSLRIDYQPLFGKMSPRSSPEVSLQGGSKTGPGKTAKIEPIIALGTRQKRPNFTAVNINRLRHVSLLLFYLKRFLLSLSGNTGKGA